MCKDKVDEEEKRKEEARVQRVRDQIVSGEQWKDFVVQPKGFVRQEKEKKQPIEQVQPVEEEKKQEKKEKKVPEVGFWFVVLNQSMAFFPRWAFITLTSPCAWELTMPIV